MQALVCILPIISISPTYTTPTLRPYVVYDPPLLVISRESVPHLYQFLSQNHSSILSDLMGRGDGWEGKERGRGD